jgi:hypothetical protein
MAIPVGIAFRMNKSIRADTDVVAHYLFTLIAKIRANSGIGSL